MLELRGPQKNSLANRVRQAVNALIEEGKECSTGNISNKVGTMSRVEYKRVLNALCDLTKSGELRRVTRGVYALRDRQTPPEKRVVMWRLLRMRHAVTADDLVELAEVSRDYACQWLRTLEKHGVVRLTRGKYRLIKDTVAMPVFDDNAKKLRELRAKKKQAALAALTMANEAIVRARNAVNNI